MQVYNSQEIIIGVQAVVGSLIFNLALQSLQHALCLIKSHKNQQHQPNTKPGVVLIILICK
jgi:hypothetical protein